jgi:mycothiol system anti-sigma-R factor
MKKFMAAPCKQIQEQIAGYVDREIEPAQMTVISHHLQDCPGCAEEATAQQKMKDLVRAHAQHVPAPASMHAKIRRRLDQEASGSSFLALLSDLLQQRPLQAFATAMLLILLSGMTTYFVWQKPVSPTNLGTQFIVGSIEGELICIDCDLLDLTATPYTHDATHRVGLRCTNGHIWSILRTEQCHELSKNFHRRVRVVGNIFEGMRYVEVKEFSFI